MTKPAALVNKLSSGGVVYRQEGDRVDVALISVKDGSVWTLPKGLVDKGESLKDAALREVREETGLQCRVHREIGASSYWYYIRSDNAKCRKTVRYFLMECVGGNIREHDSEVDRVCWFSIDQAVSALTYKGDREILKKAGPIITGQRAVESK